LLFSWSHRTGVSAKRFARVLATINPAWSIATFVVGGTLTPQFRLPNPNKTETAIREI
jgi:hypothetical protein